MSTSRIPDIEAFEERAAIAEYDGGLTRLHAEELAAQEQGFASAGEYAIDVMREALVKVWGSECRKV